MNATDWVCLGIAGYLLFLAVFIPLWHQDREAVHRRELLDREIEANRRQLEQDPVWRAMGGTSALYTDKEER